MAVDRWITGGYVYRKVDYVASLALDIRLPHTIYVDVTGDLSLSLPSPVAGGRGLVILKADGSDHNLTFSSDWVFLGDVPTRLGANKYGILRLSCVDGYVLAEWSYPSSVGDLPVGPGFEAVNQDASALSQGQPLAAAAGGNGFVAANAVSPAAPAVGLANSAAASGQLITGLLAGSLFLADWTIPTGSASLLTRSAYYVDTVAGKLTPVPPVGPGQVVQRVGTALSPNRLEIKIQPAIML